MYYIDSQRTVTRRESSLVLSGVTPRSERLHSACMHSTSHLISESGVSLGHKARSSVRKEIITSLFESMLDNIVESWEVIEQRRFEVPSSEVCKNTSELLGTSKRKKSIGLTY